MRYWAYVNNEIRGPFEKEKLAELPAFSGESLVCPENTEGRDQDWKPASVYPEVMAALSSPPAPAPAPAPAPKRPVESPLAMTMRGTLIMEPGEEPASAPAARPAPAVAPVSGVLPPPAEKTPAAGGQAEPDQLRQKLDQLGAMLLALGNTQAQLLSKVTHLETSVAEMKAMILPPPPPKK